MTTETTTESTTTGINLTSGAAEKVAALLAQEGRDDLSLRVAVQPGGCSGLRYQLYFDDRALDGDTVSAFGSVKVRNKALLSTIPTPKAHALAAILSTNSVITVSF